MLQMLAGNTFREVFEKKADWQLVANTARFLEVQICAIESALCIQEGLDSLYSS